MSWACILTKMTGHLYLIVVFDLALYYEHWYGSLVRCFSFIPWSPAFLGIRALLAWLNGISLLFSIELCACCSRESSSSCNLAVSKEIHLPSWVPSYYTSEWNHVHYQLSQIEQAR
ncbi:hypothetical protein BJX64DRAFT_152066 [Aspergillus heterothallicus]